MKKIIGTLLVILAFGLNNVNAQKFGYVDTDYILNSIPEYKAAKGELDKLSSDWQKEIELKYAEAKDLQKAKFGVDGELFKKRMELIKPIQDKVYNAVKAVADKAGLAVIFDKNSDITMLYANPKFDKSEAVLEHLGFGKKK